MRLRLPAPLLRRALLRPEPLLALLVLVAAAIFVLTAGGNERAQAPQIEIREPEERALEVDEVRLVRFDEDGLENPAFVSVALPEAPGERLAAILESLRESLLESAWPETLPVPKVFVESLGRRTVAVLDFRPEGPVSLSVAQEIRLLRSVEATVLANGIDEVRYLLDGEADGVFLEHVAVPASL